MTTTDDEVVFVDTNILIYATDALSPLQRSATTAMARARRGSTLALSPQVVGEYLVTATRPSPTGSLLPRVDVLRTIDGFLANFRLLEENATVVTTLRHLVARFGVSGKQVHDANIVATMQAHGVRRILTHNVRDFTRFSSLIEVVPL